MTATHKAPHALHTAREESLVLPSLDLLLHDIEALPAQLRFGRRNNSKYCPLAKALTMRYGGIWLVEQECILYIVLSKCDEKEDQTWCYLTPGSYAEALQRIDDPSWQPGQPQRIIRAGEVAAILRAVLVSPEPQEQQDKAV